MSQHVGKFSQTLNCGMVCTDVSLILCIAPLIADRFHDWTCCVQQPKYFIVMRLLEHTTSLCPFYSFFMERLLE